MKLWSKTKFAGLILLMACYAVVAGCLYMMGNHTLMWLNGVSTPGKITSTRLIEEDEFQDLNTSSTPSNAYNVVFVATDGRERGFTTKFSSSFKLYDIGETVTVIYWQDSPDNAKIVGFMSLYLGPLLAIFMTLVFWMLGMFLFYADKPRWKYIKN